MLILLNHRDYRQLAEENRKKAEAEPILRQSYLDVAMSCDRLADTMERVMASGLLHR